MNLIFQASVIILLVACVFQLENIIIELQKNAANREKALKEWKPK